MPKFPLCKHPSSELDMYKTEYPEEGTEPPVKSEGTLYPFLRADALLDEEESVTHRFDCNTVGPVPVTSGYGSRTLTHYVV